MEHLVKVAVIGTGRRGLEYLRVLGSGRTGLEVVALVDSRKEALQNGLNELPNAVATFRDVHELLDQKKSLGLEAVIVCTPPTVHIPVAIAALDCGLHVLCEKPLAPTRAGFYMMTNAARRNARLLMMASEFRYVDDVIRAKQMIDSGELGEVVLVRVAMAGSQEMRGKWQSVPEVSGGGVLIDKGTHAVDLARFLLGPLRQVVATETKRTQKLSVEDTAQVMFRTDKGVTGTLDLSWSISPGSPWYLTVDGSHGALRVGRDQGKVMRRDQSEWEPYGSGLDSEKALVSMLDDFSDAIRHEKSPSIDSDDALASVAVIDAAYRSMQTASWVRVVEERRTIPRS